MNPSLPLRDATVQEIQLELIRRLRGFSNDFNGEKIYASLLWKHHALWRAVLLDRHQVSQTTPNRQTF